MKIKEVCEKTNLTDKTIRYYIREGLIFPKYDENYTGRKNFNFEDSDIKRLQYVATLRKYGFSINKIKALLNSDRDIKTIFRQRLEEAKADTECSEKIYKRLNEITTCNFDNVEELCLLLSESEYIPSDVPQNDNKVPYKLLYSKNKKAKNMLAALIVAITVLSAVAIGFTCNTFYQATNSSVIDINKGFTGLRIVQTDNDNYSEEQGIELINDIRVDNDYIEASSAFESIELKKEGNTYVINATLSSDKKYVKVYPIYESKDYSDIVLYNSTCWLGVYNTEAVEIKSKQAYKSKHCKYKYDIKINNSIY